VYIFSSIAGLTQGNQSEFRPSGRKRLKPVQNQSARRQDYRSIYDGVNRLQIELSKEHNLFAEYRTMNAAGKPV